MIYLKDQALPHGCEAANSWLLNANYAEDQLNKFVEHRDLR